VSTSQDDRKRAGLASVVEGLDAALRSAEAEVILRLILRLILGLILGLII
jgi:hypothetical protein